MIEFDERAALDVEPKSVYTKLRTPFRVGEKVHLAYLTTTYGGCASNQAPVQVGHGDNQHRFVCRIDQAIGETT